MSRVTRILVPTDFSPVCDRALARAAAIAARTGAELHVVHVQVLHREMYGWAALPNIVELEGVVRDLCRSDLDKAVANIATPVVREVVQDFKEVPAIVHYVEAHKIDLIVMGTHARKGISRLFLGSVAAGVLREAPVSVVLLGPERELCGDSQHCVLVPVDFSESSIAALRQAVAIARQHQAELIVLHVVELPKAVPYVVGMVESLAAVHERAVQALDQLLDSIDLPQPSAQRVVLTGRPDEQIAAQARKLDADIIVMGMLGASGLRRLLLGSTTERVLRDAPCPVLAHRGSILEDL